MIDPLYVLRDVEVPVGARARVRARIEDELDRAVLPKRRAVPLALAVTATTALAALLALFAWPRSQARHEVAVPAVRDPAPIVIADHWAAPASDRSAAAAPPRALDAPLDVILDDAAQPIVHTMQLTVRVVAGSVHVVKPVITTETIELTPPAPRVTEAFGGELVSPPNAVRAPTPPAPKVEEASEPAPAPAVTAAPAASEPADSIEPAAPVPDKLAEAVREYRAATALESSDPTAAVNAWQAWRTRWSQTALAHGADLRLLALLGKLDRRAEATSLAREFLRRYPRSPRRADVERVLEGAR